MFLFDLLFGSTNSSNHDFKLGDYVYVPSYGIYGYIIDINGDLITIKHTKENDSSETHTFNYNEIKHA